MKLTLKILRDWWQETRKNQFPYEHHLQAKAHREAGKEFDSLIDGVRAQERKNAHIAFQEEAQASIDDAARHLAARVWDEAITACHNAVAFPDRDETIHLPSNPYQEAQT